MCVLPVDLNILPENLCVYFLFTSSQPVCTCSLDFLFVAGVIQEQLAESQIVHHQMEEELSKVKQVSDTISVFVPSSCASTLYDSSE